MVAIPFVLWHASSRAFTATLGDTGVRRAQGLGARHGHGAWPALQLAPAGSCRGHPCSSCRHATELKEAGKNYWTEGRAFHQFFSLLVTSYAVALFFRHVAFFKQSTMVCVDKVFALLFFAEVACRVQDLGLRQYGGKVSSWLDTGLMSLLMLDAFILSRSQMEVLILSWVRFLRGILNLTVIFEVVVDAPLWLQRLTGILFFVALSVLLREAGIVPVLPASSSGKHMAQRRHCRSGVAALLVAAVAACALRFGATWVCGPSPRSRPAAGENAAEARSRRSVLGKEGPALLALASTLLGADSSRAEWGVGKTMETTPPKPSENPYIRGLQKASWELEPTLRTRTYLQSQNQPYFVHTVGEGYKFDVFDETKFRTAGSRLQKDTVLSSPDGKLRVYTYKSPEDRDWAASKLKMKTVEFPEDLKKNIEAVKKNTFGQ